MKFLRDAPKQKVIKSFEMLGFRIISVGNHVSMIRENPVGSKTPLTMPNHERIKGSTLRTICRQAAIPRDEFLKTYGGGVKGVKG
ncbi:MAG: type II toxin-antitoxin system HicA family toxin [Chloroflexota bacterium]